VYGQGWRAQGQSEIFYTTALLGKHPIMFGTRFRASARIDWEPFYRAMGLEDSGDTRDPGWKRER
jgi:hypothetical protein